MVIIRGHRALAEAYAAHCLDVYDHYAWRFWLSQDGDKAWHFLAADDRWQSAYFDGAHGVKSAELNFWLGATPMADALPTPSDSSTRQRPALQAETGGISPAVGPNAAAAHPAATRRGKPIAAPVRTAAAADRRARSAPARPATAGTSSPPRRPAPPR